MQSKQIRLPLLSLENEYTYLNTKPKKNNKLEQFILELTHMKKTKKLPAISHKYIDTARKFQNKLTEIQQIIAQPKSTKLQRTLSTPYPYQHISPYQYNNLQQTPAYYPYYYLPQLPTDHPKDKPKQQGEPLPKQVKQEKKQQKKSEINQQISNKNIKQIIQIPEKFTINKFRVAGYVVYFAIYFKYFSRKFTQLRKNWFHQRYTINDGKIILQGSTKILKHLHEIDLFKMINMATQRAKDINISSANYKSSKSSEEILTLTHFITLLLEYVHSYMNTPKFIQEHHEVFTVGVLHQNFMVTNLYLPQEAALLHIHNKGYIQVEEETEIVLLMLKIIVKILVFNYLLGLRYSRYWSAKQEKSYSLHDKEIENIWSLARNAAIFICIVCEQIYDKATLKMQASPRYSLNFSQLATKFNILPSKALQQLKQQKTPNPNRLQSKFIINLKGYTQVKYFLQHHELFKRCKQKIQNKIINLLTTIYTSIKYEEIKIYHFIWLTTLDQQFLICKGIKEDIKLNKKRKKIKNKQKNIVGFQDKLEQINEDDNQSKQGTNAQIDENNDDEDQQEEGNEKAKDRKKRKKMRFKLQQQYYDHKFEGHTKLQKLKSQMIKK